MKVLLIQPFTITPKAVLPYLPQEPLGLEYLSAYLKSYSRETEVRVLDCIGEFWRHHEVLSDGRVRVGAHNSQISQVLREFNPDIVGVPLQFYNQEEAVREVVSTAKWIKPHITTVVGGCAANADPINLMKRIEALDVIVLGEGEEALKELADGWPLAQVEGIVYRKGGLLFRNEPRPYIAIDTIPFPDRRAVPFDAYSLSFMTGRLSDRLKVFDLWWRYNRDWSTIRDSLNTSRSRARPKVAAMLAARGCPYNCYFCSSQNVWQRKHRQRSVHKVLIEMAYLYNEFGVRTFHFMDDNFNVDEKWVRMFCEGIIESGMKVELRFQSGFFPRINRDTLSLLKSAGLRDILFGIESGNQRVLDEVIRKPVNLKHVEQIIRWCHELGIICGGFFVIGIPGEKRSEMQDTINFALHSGLNRARLYTCQPMPGSQLYDDCLKNGWLAPDYDPAKSLVVGPDFFINTPDFTPEQVMRLAMTGRELLRDKKLLYQRRS
jgi:magnesium-protoporphyrin IX monomethyl ester (oxidative) cyclase